MSRFLIYISFIILGNEIKRREILTLGQNVAIQTSTETKYYKNVFLVVFSFRNFESTSENIGK